MPPHSPVTSPHHNLLCTGHCRQLPPAVCRAPSPWESIEGTGSAVVKAPVGPGGRESGHCFSWPFRSLEQKMCCCHTLRQTGPHLLAAVPLAQMACLQPSLVLFLRPAHQHLPHRFPPLGSLAALRLVLLLAIMAGDLVLGPPCWMIS